MHIFPKLYLTYLVSLKTLASRNLIILRHSFYSLTTIKNVRLFIMQPQYVDTMCKIMQKVSIKSK